MRFETSNGYFDYDLNLFAAIAHPLDEKIGPLLDACRRHWDFAESCDYPDTVEQLIGVGFAAAQVYIVAALSEHGVTKGTDGGRPLRIGPKHASGEHLVRLINHGANFWKHADEWDWDALRPSHAEIVRAFRTVGVAERDLGQLYSLLIAITGAKEPRLGLLAVALEEWHTALDESYPAPTG